MSLNAYRMDSRTEEAFIRDIAVGTVAERDIILRYAHYVKRIYDIDIVVTDNGCDNSGQFLTESQVTTKADFLINGKPAEVKFNNAILSKFRAKASQVGSYYKQGASIIWVNGYLSKCPKFTLITVEKLLQIMNTLTQEPFEVWGGKMCYVLDSNDYDWFDLDKLDFEIAPKKEEVA